MTTGALTKTNSVIDESLESPEHSVSSEESIVDFSPRRKFSSFFQGELAKYYVHPEAHLAGEENCIEAVNILINFKIIADSTNSSWSSPLVNVNAEEKEIVLEWWNNKRKVTVYIEDGRAEYIKVWGADIETEMEDDELKTPDDMLNLWLWLTCQNT